MYLCYKDVCLQCYIRVCLTENEKTVDSVQLTNTKEHYTEVGISVESKMKSGEASRVPSSSLLPSGLPAKYAQYKYRLCLPNNLCDKQSTTIHVFIALFRGFGKPRTRIYRIMYKQTSFLCTLSTDWREKAGKLEIQVYLLDHTDNYEVLLINCKSTRF